MAQAAVDVEGMGGGAAAEALGEDDLNRVAGDDVLLHPLDVHQVVLAGDVGLDARGGARDGRSVFGDGRERAAEAVDKLVDLPHRLAVGGFDVAVETDVADHFDHVLEVVEDEERV